MSGFVLHPQAYEDLDEIWEHIAGESVVAADRVLGEIYDSIQLLVSFRILVTFARTSPHGLCAFSRYETI